MRVNDSCAKCMYDRQCAKTDNKEYLFEIKNLLDNRPEDITSCELNMEFNRLHEQYIGKLHDFKDEKKQFNDLVLSMEDDLRKEIEASDNSLATSIIMARIGNYIDFPVLGNVNPDEFLKLFGNTQMRIDEMDVYKSFCDQCAKAKSFLLLTDNCGEIVLDKLMLEQLKKRFPNMELTVMVRGEDVSNDATIEDATYVGIDKVANVITNGRKMAGTVYELVSDEAKKAIDNADIIFSKGQANFESFSGEGRHAFYAFLCKCQLFTTRFQVPQFTGMLVEE